MLARRMTGAANGVAVKSSHRLAWSRRAFEELFSDDYEWSDALFLAIVGTVFAVIAIVVVVMTNFA